jgi:hypothetical protein
MNNFDDDITAGKIPKPGTGLAPERRLVPLQVGNATVYIEAEGVAETETDDSIYPVAAPSPKEVFSSAGDTISECVRLVGERIEHLAEAVKPEQVTLEFSVSFEVKGKASPIPVFVTGETGVKSGLKVTAVWRPTATKS